MYDLIEMRDADNSWIWAQGQNAREAGNVD
jgi:hypothetical protein